MNSPRRSIQPAKLSCGIRTVENHEVVGDPGYDPLGGHLFPNPAGESGIVLESLLSEKAYPKFVGLFVDMPHSALARGSSGKGHLPAMGRAVPYQLAGMPLGNVLGNLETNDKVTFPVHLNRPGSIGSKHKHIRRCHANPIRAGVATRADFPQFAQFRKIQSHATADVENRLET